MRLLIVAVFAAAACAQTFQLYNTTTTCDGFNETVTQVPPLVAVP